MLNGLPEGVGARLHLIRPEGEVDLLWCVEEALRSAPIALVIAEPEKPLSLTAGRRLQLAAEAGRKGGQSVRPAMRSFSRNHELASEAGRKGGHASHAREDGSES